MPMTHLPPNEAKAMLASMLADFAESDLDNLRPYLGHCGSPDEAKATLVSLFADFVENDLSG